MLVFREKSIDIYFFVTTQLRWGLGLERIL